MDTPTVAIDHREDAIVLRLSGPARVAAAEQLREKFLQIGTRKNLVLAWKNAEHVDASVLQVLLAIRSELAAGGLALRVEEDNAMVRHYLQVSGLAGYFPAPAGGAGSSNESPAHV